MNRRESIWLMGGAGALLSMPNAFGAEKSSPVLRKIPSSDEKLPAIGLGTWQTFDVGRGASERDPLKGGFKGVFRARREAAGFVADVWEIRRSRGRFDR